MKKISVILIAIIVLVSCIFISCSKNENDKDKDSNDTTGIDAVADDVGFISQEVTDKDGKNVTDKNGNKVTTMVAVKYDTDKNGNTVANVIDDNGNDTGETISVENTTTTTNSTIKADRTTTTTHKPTGTTKNNVSTTKSDDTTACEGEDSVPKTSATGKEVSFTIEDQEIISSMLEVPYLYKASYENEDGVPISIAAHTAVWMAERDGGTNQIYPSSPIVLNLFKFYGQTVVNFKPNCNTQNTANAPIKYIARDDTFEISGYTPKKQTVVITKIEDLGNNNYYKVTGKVSNAGDKTKVVAIIQKNRLDTSLGFSIKALKWS